MTLGSGGSGISGEGYLNDSDFTQSGIMITDGSGEYDVIPNNGEGFLKRDGSGNFKYENISIDDLRTVNINPKDMI